MLSRREALLGGVSFAVLASLSARTVAQEDESFICSTVEPPPGAPEVGVSNFSASAEGGTIGQLTVRAEQAGLTPFGTARLKDIWLRSDGRTPGTGIITLGIYFADGDDRQKDLVRLHASKWLEGSLGKVLQFDFGVTHADADISITFNTKSNSSKVGRASREAAKTGISMNLHNQSERAICHEFGHALGLHHEHSNPGASFEWIENEVFRDMAEQDWTPAMVRSNIFAKFGKDYACLGDPKFNAMSIMVYEIRPNWTKSGLTIPLRTKISDGDRKCLVALYRAA